MVSAIRYPLDYNSSTFGNVTRDYTLVATWESATDTDLVSATKGEVLFCYPDSAYYNDYPGQIAGATVNANYYRMIMTAPGETQVEFSQAGTVAYPWWIDELYFGIQNLKINFNSSTYGIWLNYPGNHVVGCVISGTATESLITDNDFGAGSVFIINCLFYEITGTAVRAYGAVGNEKNIFYNCTIADCTGSGFGGTRGTCIAKNCISDGNGTDYETGWTKTTCLDSTDNVVFNDRTNDDYSLDPTDTAAKDQGTDLSSDSDYAFDDDIIGMSRPQGLAWDIGAYEYSVTPIPGGIMSNPVFIDCPADQWTKVATNVTGGVIHKVGKDQLIYLQSYRVTGDSAPTLKSEGVLAFKNQVDPYTEEIASAVGNDIYIYPIGEAGRIRVDV